MLLSIASLAVSAVAIFISIGVPTEREIWSRAANWFLLTYGVITIAILALAWRRGRVWQILTTAALAASLFLVILVSSFDGAFISGLEVAFLLGEAIALFTNCVAITVVAWPFGAESPNPSSQRATQAHSRLCCH